MDAHRTNDGPQPGDFWYVEPPHGDVKVAEVVLTKTDGEHVIEPTGMTSTTARGWTFLKRLEPLERE